MTDDLTRILPDDLKQRAVSTSNELVLPYPEVLAAIRMATEHAIAILGVEAFEVRKDGFKVVDYSGYEFQFRGDWDTFVKSNNAEAMRYVEAHRLGENHGYILTSASSNEFAALK